MPAGEGQLTLPDENMPLAPHVIRFGIALRQLSYEWGRKSIFDEEIVAISCRQKRTTPLTRD